jgi:hypothetical protein
MAKIIDSEVTFYGGGERLDISFLDSTSFYAIKLSKQCNVKNMLIGKEWEHYGSWCPLGFERSIIYG